MNFFSELKANPKKKAKIKLIIYGIFFLFVFIILNLGKSINYTSMEEANLDDNTNLNKTISSYEYNFTFNFENSVDVIKGIYFNNKSLFYYNNQQYYYENYVYLIDNQYYYKVDIAYDVSKFLSTEFNKLIENMTKVSSVEYSDGTTKSIYKLPMNEYNSFYYGVNNDINDDIQVEIVSVNNINSEIIFNFLNNDKIVLEYINVNKISNLEFDKENYIYKE